MALGKGLAALIPNKQKTKTKKIVAGKTTKKELDDGLGAVFLRQEAGQRVIELDVNAIKKNDYQPRKYFDPERLQELADSIKQYGIIQPLVVTGNEQDGFQLIAGERRLEASKQLGLEKVPVIVKDADEQERLELALVENMQRHDLNPIEEARGCQLLMEEFGLSQASVGGKVGRSRSAVANIMRLLDLPVEVQKGLIEGRITAGHARSILAIKNPEKQIALYREILKGGLTVREAETKTKKVKVSGHSRSIMDDPEMAEIERRLQEVLGTKVQIKNGGKIKRLLIDFSGKKELSDILERMSNV